MQNNRLGKNTNDNIRQMKKTREHSRSSGKKAETYNQILRRLMSLAQYKGFMEKQCERLKDKEAFVSLDEL